MHAVLAVLLALADGFDYGSYGRVSASTDLDGGPGVSTNVVAHGSRLEEQPYLELDVYYGQPMWRVVTSLAVAGELFHFSGKFAADLAVRNLYLSAELEPWLAVWAGSRMYRGDDIYLFDYWPLDNLNTVGAGVFLRPDHWEIALHAGVNRLDDPYQFQMVDQPSPDGGPPNPVVTLDRIRAIESFKLTYLASWWKASLYAEAHEIGEGTFTNPDRTTQKLPSDDGFLVGGQLGLWRPGAYANLFVRGATGLAAYGELAVPFAVDSNRQAAGAREFVAALSAGVDGRRAGVLVGAYARYFEPADPAAYSLSRFWEGIVAARPQWFVTPHFGVAGEVSLQGRTADALDPLTGGPADAAVLKLTAMPAVITLAPGMYGRPQLRVVYTASFLSSGAQALLSRFDERLGSDTIQYLGVQAEWWFNSAYR